MWISRAEPQPRAPRRSAAERPFPDSGLVGRSDVRAADGDVAAADHGDALAMVTR